MAQLLPEKNNNKTQRQTATDLLQVNVLALPCSLLHQVLVCQAWLVARQTKTHPHGSLVGVHQAVIMCAHVVAEADGLVVSLEAPLEDVDGLWKRWKHWLASVLVSPYTFFIYKFF